MKSRFLQNSTKQDLWFFSYFDISAFHEVPFTPPPLVSHHETSRKTLRPPNSYAWNNYWTDPKRPSINISKFNYEYLAEILTKIKTENKNITLMGDFFTNLLTNYCKNRGRYLFLEQLFNHNSTLEITLSTRITERTATLIDSDCNWTWTQNHLLRKQTLNDLDNLAKLLTCVLSTYLYGGQTQKYNLGNV